MNNNFSLLSQADIIVGRDLDADTYLPRITPPRASIRLNYKKSKLQAHAEARYISKATRINEVSDEGETDAYTLVNLGASYNLKHNNSNIRLYSQIRNLLDQETRNHASFTKGRMQRGSRNIVVGIEASF